MFSFNPFHVLGNRNHVGPDKNLLMFLEAEKTAAKQWARMSEERRISANHLKMFGQPLGDDLTDVTSKLGELLILFSSTMTEFSSSYDQYCDTMKTMADKESTLLSDREKRARLIEAIERHEQEHPGGVDKLMQLKEQLAKVESKTLPAETGLGNYQRIAMREAMYLLLNGMDEMASKMDMIASFGKYIVDELDVTPIEPGQGRPEYSGSERTATVVKDVKRAVDFWKPDGAKLRRTLTSQHGHNPLVKKLPPAPPVPTTLTDDELPTREEKEKDDAEKTQENDEQLENEEEKADEDDNASFYSMSNTATPTDKPEEASHKPDEPSPSSRYLHVRNTSTESNPGGFYPPQSPRPAVGPGGFSSVYLDQQQNLYQFYQHYAPPQPYEDMARHHYRPSPFASPYMGPQQGGAGGSHLGPGGFVLPSSNPYYHSPAAPPIQPQPSISTSTLSSLPSTGGAEATPSASPSQHNTTITNHHLTEDSESPQSEDHNNDDHDNHRSSS
ncbi:Eisosome component PIL1-domain-containing protein [Zychaea mexicana]|uniref:Eisosome component PIL1-domain-containing protein n=1 Tax=Zychaea mexicana TaxID=64656 RepID=UPI0022FEC3DE|nr:Eisosome component PIL1-domain-containing protein [Zychaea mexicana]KAI9494036.1 Eisosome component PIL1-domain-containing protein [Zychaea mexicana]